MEKDQPPPYSAATGTHPLPGFGAPPPPSSQPQPYPSEHEHQQSYPQQHGPQPYPPQHGAQPYPSQHGPQPYPTQPGHPQPGYPQPQHPYGAPPMQMQGSTTVVVSYPAVVAGYGPNPQPMTCPHCHQHMTTRIDTEPSMRTHIIALICCLMGCIPCCIIPYCMDSCQTKNHYCPRCGAFLGNYNSDAEFSRRW